MKERDSKDTPGTHARDESRIKHGDSERWKNFAVRIQKNPFVREYLMKKYNGICQRCGRPIREGFKIQHATYDRECISDETIRIKKKTKKRPGGTRKVPDCEECPVFYECVDGALHPVHARCGRPEDKEMYGK